MTSTTIILTRHGRTAWHHGNRYTGSSDIEIDDVGHQQAAVLAAWAVQEPPDALWASTMLRARQTAAPVAAALGMPVATDERLRELDFGDAEGVTLAELRVHDPQAVQNFLRDPVEHHLPGGEHPERAAGRATAALRDIAARHLGESVLVVCHNTLIRLVVCRYLQIPMRTYRTALRGIAPTATTRLVIHQDGAVMLDGYNHLPSRPESQEAAHAQTV